MRRAARILGGGLTLLVVITTLLPLVRSDEWWIRIFDFPRLQIALVALLALMIVMLCFQLRRVSTLAAVAALLGCIAYQALAILPYTPLGSREVAAVASCAPANQLRIVVANLEISNRESEPAIQLFARTRPDVLLVMETDAWWLDQLSLIEEQFPYRVKEPRDSPWGIALYSRLELVDPKVRYLSENYAPSIWAGLRLRSGKVIDFYGLHPKPPKPPWDTDKRDDELLTVSREVRERETNAIVAGDLNDVAWSRTTKEFREISGLLDPRRGRGLYATFSAEVPWILRWPLDHVFLEEGFTLLNIRLLEDVNSDHFPLLIDICTA